MDFCKTPKIRLNFLIGSLNVGGLKSRSMKIAKILENVKNLTILVFQETHFSHENETIFFIQVFEPNFQIFHSFALSRCSGITILINRNFIFQNFENVFEIKGRALCLKLKLNTEVILFIGIYAPATPNDRYSFFTDLNGKISDCIGYTDIIIVGDFNCVETPSIDLFPSKTNRIEPGILE